MKEERIWFRVVFCMAGLFSGRATGCAGAMRGARMDVDERLPRESPQG
jgi:hypothetical protein